MKVLHTIAELRDALEPHRGGGTIGLTPTMGALHEGHIALFEAARKECDTVVATIFVNPAQFADPADLERYPRHEGATPRLRLRRAVDFLFAPPVAE